MANDPDLLVRYARLGRGELNAMREVARKHAPAVAFDPAVFAQHIEQVVDDRLAFADRLLAFSTRMLNGAGGGGDADMVLRMALARSYYAAYHALRALHMAFEGWDPDGHKETVEATVKLFVKHPALAARFSWATPGLPAALTELLEERHVADYHFYGRDVERPAPLDFAVQAPRAYTLGTSVVGTVRIAIADRRSGVL